MQFVDPEVSRKKFEQEISLFEGVADAQRRRGVIMLESKFPNACFAFSATNLTPPAIAFAVRFNFDNYDLLPISIKFINPFTFESLKQDQIPVQFLRNIGPPDQPINPLSPQVQALLQQEPSPEALPFLCIPGVREYHDHPAHSGDSWLLHRKNCSEGSLGYLIDKLHQYGISSIGSYNVLVQVQASAFQARLGLNPQSIPI